jgi:hypothetical protein
MNFYIDNYQSPWHIDVRRYQRARADRHGKEAITMFHIDHDAWLIGRNDPVVERNRMHLVALQEARMASEYRSSRSDTATAPRAIGRVAIAAGGAGSSVDLAACCA